VPVPVNETVTFQPAFARGLTIVVAVLSAGALGWTAAGDPTTALRYLPVFLLVPVATWALYGRPAVVISDSGVELRNVTRTVELPWPAIVRIDTKYALTLETAYGVFAAWAAPAPSRTAVLHATRSHVQHQPESAYYAGGVRPGDLAGTASGDAAGYLRRRWEQLRDAGYLDDPRLERDRPRVRWHLGPALAVAVLAVAAVVVPRLV
jgi:hypothetical protein